MRRTLIAGALLAFIIPLTTSALTVDEIQTQIKSLLQQIQQLQQQLITFSSTTQPVACTMDAKICPDGSSVGRVGPRCEFASCPGSGGGQDNAPPAWCIKYANLEFGARGAAVTALQSAIGDTELGSAPTGYYGSLTRDVWRRRCFPKPIGSDTLSISGVSGPTTLLVGEQGTWSVNAKASSTATLSYRVMWGDEGAEYGIAALANSDIGFTQTATFTHTYQSAGTYAPRFTVRDTGGNSAASSVTVKVGTTGVTVGPWSTGGGMSFANWDSANFTSCAMETLQCSAGQQSVVVSQDTKGCHVRKCAFVGGPSGGVSTGSSCTTDNGVCTPVAACISGGTYYAEGYTTNTIVNSDGTTQSILDARYVCKNSQWVVKANGTSGPLIQSGGADNQ